MTTEPKKMIGPPTLRERRQLELVKGLLDDAVGAAALPGEPSRVRAILLLDLAVETILSLVLVRGAETDEGGDGGDARGDMSWNNLWQDAQGVAKAAGVRLRGGKMLRWMHDARNIAQHNSTVPTTDTLERFIPPARTLVAQIFADIFASNFSRFHSWEVLTNDDVRHVFSDASDAIDIDQPGETVWRCKWLYDEIIESFRSVSSRNASPEFVRHSISRMHGRGVDHDVRDELEKLGKVVSQLYDYLTKRVEAVESEMYAIAVGGLILEVRQFKRLTSGIYINKSGKQIWPTGASAKDFTLEHARFALDFAARLYVLFHERYPEVVERVEVPAGYKPLARSTE